MREMVGAGVLIFFSLVFEVVSYSGAFFTVSFLFNLNTVKFRFYVYGIHGFPLFASNFCNNSVSF